MASPARPPLVSPMEGTYVIRRAGRVLGEERFSIGTSSTGEWRVQGDARLSFPVERRQGYLLAIDASTYEPSRIEAFIELLGERFEIRGRREGDYFNFESRTPLGRSARAVPYALGTVLDFPSPVFSAFPLALLGPSLVVDHPVRVRAISVEIPSLQPRVLLASYELRGFEGGRKKVALSSEGDPRATALWVRADGLPVRVRTWVDEGPPIELVLTATVGTRARALPANP